MTNEPTQIAALLGVYPTTVTRWQRLNKAPLMAKKACLWEKHIGNLKDGIPEYLRMEE